MKDLTDLRKIAEAATPGPWEVDNLDQVVRTPNYDIVHDDSCADSEEWSANTDAPFIATFDPPTVLSLITRLEQAEAAVARVREVATGDPTEYGWSEAMLAVLRALDGEPNEV